MRPEKWILLIAVEVAALVAYGREGIQERTHRRSACRSHLESTQGVVGASLASIPERSPDGGEDLATALRRLPPFSIPGAAGAATSTGVELVGVKADETFVPPPSSACVVFALVERTNREAPWVVLRQYHEGRVHERRLAVSPS